MEIRQTWSYPCPSGLKDCKSPQGWNYSLNYVGAVLSFIDMGISILLLALWIKNKTILRK